MASPFWKELSILHQKNAPSVRNQESAQQIAEDREAFLKSRWDSIL